MKINAKKIQVILRVDGMEVHALLNLVQLLLPQHIIPMLFVMDISIVVALSMQVEVDVWLCQLLAHYILQKLNVLSMHLQILAIGMDQLVLQEHA